MAKWPVAYRTRPTERAAEEFIGAADKCRTFADLETLLAGIVADLGFDYFALLHHASLRSPPGGRLVRLLQYPEGWLAEYDRRGFAACDPIHLASGRVNTGFDWDSAGAIVTLADRHKAVLERSVRFGVGRGFTVPANIPGEAHGSCSFAMRAGRRLPRSSLRCAELIGAHAFRTARRIAGIGSPAPVPHLSRRELECVQLVAEGKSDFEISLILGISPATAAQYVKRARAAYDVVSRSQLAVQAMIDGRLSLEQLRRGR